jgi:predicted nucleic acid-binding protein
LNVVAGPTVANSSPLIALQQIGQLDLLRALFGDIAMPPAVAAEITPSIPTIPGWLRIQPLAQPLAAHVLQAALGAGESEALSLAVELTAARAVIDERAARRVAEGMGIPVIGTLGMLLLAKRRGLIPAVRPLIDDLLRHDFRVADDLLENVLRSAGEAPP